MGQPLSEGREVDRDKQPTLGRIVIFCNPDGEDRAAIISGVVGDGIVHLTVFRPESPGGTYSAMSVKALEGDAPWPNTWRWPERV